MIGRTTGNHRKYVVFDTVGKATGLAVMWCNQNVNTFYNNNVMGQLCFSTNLYAQHNLRYFGNGRIVTSYMANTREKGNVAQSMGL